MTDDTTTRNRAILAAMDADARRDRLKWQMTKLGWSIELAALKMLPSVKAMTRAFNDIPPELRKAIERMAK